MERRRQKSTYCTLRLTRKTLAHRAPPFLLLDRKLIDEIGRMASFTEIRIMLYSQVVAPDTSRSGFARSGSYDSLLSRSRLPLPSSGFAFERHTTLCTLLPKFICPTTSSPYGTFVSIHFVTACMRPMKTVHIMSKINSPWTAGCSYFSPTSCLEMTDWRERPYTSSMQVVEKTGFLRRTSHSRSVPSTSRTSRFSESSCFTTT